MNDLRSSAIQVVREASKKASRVPPDYYKQTRTEVVGYLFPRLLIKRRETFWLETLSYFSGQLSAVEQIKCIETMVEKNKLYGNTQLYIMGSLGILIRSLDKIERIRNIDNGATSKLLAEESKQDSLMDLFNYSILAVLVLRKEL